MSHARRWRYQRGTTLPETAIVLVVMLMVLFGIIDFGRAMYTYSFVANIAREGARWAIVRGSQCTVLTGGCPATAPQVQAYVQSLSEGATTASSISVTTSWPGTGTGCSGGTGGAGLHNVAGCPVVVTVTYPFKFILPYMPRPTLTMSSSSTMVISQ
jgi:Flp pilus assembly protein TadG